MVREAVDGLLHAVRHRPTELPIAEMAALSATAHEVEIDCDPAGAFVYVTRRPSVSLEVLSLREREVAMLAVGGFSNQQISSGLSISVHTVKDHMHSILTKTGLESRSQLIAAWYGGLRTSAPTLPCSSGE